MWNLITFSEFSSFAIYIYQCIYYICKRFWERCNREQRIYWMTFSITFGSFYNIFIIVFISLLWYLSRSTTKPTKWPVRPAKTQISLGFRPVWSKTSSSVWRNLGPLATHWMHNEDSDQTGRMPRLIWVFAVRSCKSFCLFYRAEAHLYLSC